jgi:glutamate-5-semialdehyde dehydrogenase
MFDSNLQKTVDAARKLNEIRGEKISQILQNLADEIENSTPEILAENLKDLQKMDAADPKFDRLKLTESRLKEIANSIREISNFKNFVGEVLQKRKLKSGIFLRKIRAPLGVVAVIFEARPNVFYDCFALCLKSKNAAVLRGSSSAENSNAAAEKIIKKVLRENSVDENSLFFVPPNREFVKKIFTARGKIDVLLARGGKNLIDFVRENSQIPFIETGASVVHCFVDESADLNSAAEIIFNAKTQRPSVCNALDCVLIHENLAEKLPAILRKTLEFPLEKIYACEKSAKILRAEFPNLKIEIATDETFATEFLSLKLAVKIVENLDAALDHISKFSLRHSEIIISENPENLVKFENAVDAAVIFKNCSSRFCDGGEFGLGAEVGISTQKLHARGPFGAESLTTWKWVCDGAGEVRV